jgi:steroid delta-isomerase-like uncharacterized protein
VSAETDPRAVVEAFVEEVWNGEDPAALEALTTPDFALHQLVADEDHDRESFAAFRAEMHDAMPDFSMVIEDLVVEGDDAVALLRMGGTPVKPLQAVQPTGESFSVHAFHKYRVDDGRIAEAWLMVDAIGTMSQLGLFPPGPRMLARVAAGKLKAKLFGG